MIISQLAFMFLVFILIIVVIVALKEKNPILSGIAVILSWFVFITAPNVQVYEYVSSIGFVTQSCGYDFFGWLGFALAIFMFIHLILSYFLGGGSE